MSEINDGGPAFPRNGKKWDGPNEVEWDWPQEGMSLRDYFAGQYLAGRGAKAIDNKASLAEVAYQVADAMIRARGEQSNG